MKERPCIQTSYMYGCCAKTFKCNINRTVGQQGGARVEQGPLWTQVYTGIIGREILANIVLILGQ